MSVDPRDLGLEQHDERGRFTPGNRSAAGGTSRMGRASMARETAYLKRMQEVVTVEEWEEICKTAVIDAKAGNWRARSWLSDYLLGKPAILVDATVTARMAPIAVLPPLEGQTDADLVRNMMLAALERGVAGNIEDFTNPPIEGDVHAVEYEGEDASMDP